MDPLLDLVVRLAGDGLLLAALLSLPGISILLLLPELPATWARLGVLAVGASLLYLIASSAFMLQLGLFSMVGVCLAAAIPTSLALVRWRRNWSRLMAVRVDAPSLAPAAIVGVLVLVVLLVTPQWNFLVAPNMDAGNYEVYGNHFWKTGSLYLDARDLLGRGAAPEWLASHNTWAIDQQTGIGRPYYLPGYPILLAIFKADFNTALASSLANEILASLSAMLMVLIGLEIARARVTVVLLVLALCITPIFIYYGKQLMSEELGLFGTLLIVQGMLESRRRAPGGQGRSSPHVATLGISVGLGIGLLSRLDFFLILPLFVLGLLVVELDSWWYRESAKSVTSFVWPGVVVSACSLSVAALGVPSYLRHGRPEALADIASPNVFLAFYGVGFAIAVVLIAVLRRFLERKERPLIRAALGRAGQTAIWSLAVGWVAFLLWNLFVRPYSPDPGPLPHDPRNLLRLFEVSSPVLLGAVLILSPWVIVYRRVERAVAVMLISGLAFVVYASRHSELDLWWMRRYLAFLIPILLVVLACAVDELRHGRRASRFRAVPIASVALLALVLTQAVQNRPIFVAETNPDVPRRLSQLGNEVPDDSVVLVLDGNAMVRGLANTYRSLSGQTVLVDVTIGELESAERLVAPDQNLIVVSPSPLDQQTIVSVDLGPSFYKGVVERQWADWLKDLYADPNPSVQFEYWLYRNRDPASS